MLFGIGFGGRDDLRVAVFSHRELPVGVVDLPVAFGAEEGEVVQVCRAAVLPIRDVVDFAPLRWASAHDAAVVADGDSVALGWCGESDGASECEWDAVCVDDDGCEVRGAGE